VPLVAAPRIDLASLLPIRVPPWPLAEPPSLQPHLDVAMAHDACSDAFAKRHEQESLLRAYVAAWCRLRGGDRGQLDELARLASSTTAIGRAARLDVINWLADYEGSVAAIQFLDRFALGEPMDLDTLAATYLALGDHDEAFAVGTRVLNGDPIATPVRWCERLLAWTNLDTPQLATQLADITDDAGACVKRAHATSCALQAAGRTDRSVGARLIAMRECYLALPDDPDREARLAVMVVHAGWVAMASATWLDLAREAETAIGVTGAEELAIAALENVYKTSCERDVLDAVRDAAARIAAHEHHSPSFDTRLAALRADKPCPPK